MHRSRLSFCFLILCVVALAIPQRAESASVVLASQFVGDIDVPGPQTVNVGVDFSAASDISGIGIVAGWTGVVRDNGGGLNPWSLDMRLTTTSPSGTGLVWDPIGGDITIADYPFADYSPAYAAPQAGGMYNVAISTPGVPNPWVSGLRDTTLYALGDAPDVVMEYDGSVASGPEWNRPFFIDAISGLGPVFYDVIEFTVPVSGSYSFLSELLTDNNNFNFIYRGGFDPNLPLENLLDYGLGNGSAPNGTPRGTSLIESLLLAGETYHYITSQFEQAIPGSAFETTITGPASIDIVPDGLVGDFDADFDYDCTDVDALVLAISTGANDSFYELTGDDLVNVDDLSQWLLLAGAENLGSGNSYLPADMNLDGIVDGLDFIVWNDFRFTSTPAFCSGDVNADGTVDGLDFIVWNDFRFQSAGRASVPEPGGVVLAIIGFWICAKKNRHLFRNRD